MTIWQKRIEALKNKGMSQAKIARESGCSVSAISLIATGKRDDVSYRIGKRIVELCDLVGVDLEQWEKENSGDNNE